MSSDIHRRDGTVFTPAGATATHARNAGLATAPDTTDRAADDRPTQRASMMATGKEREMEAGQCVCAAEHAL